MLQAKSASRTVDRPAPGTDHGPRSESASTDLNYDSDDSLRLVGIIILLTKNISFLFILVRH